MAYRYFLNTSLFLCEHEWVKEFSDIIDSTPENKKFFLICERHEDVEPIRTQIYHAVLSKKSDKNQILDQIHSYTLDTFSEHLYNNIFINQHDKKKFISIKSQIDFIQYLLMGLNYRSPDIVHISQQILTLCDLKLPPDESIWKIFHETYTDTKSPHGINITEQFLKQFAVVWKCAQLLFDNYVRAQSFITDYMENNFVQDIKQHFALNSKNNFINDILHGQVVWITQPQFKQHGQLYSIQEGTGVQPHFGEDFCRTLHQAQIQTHEQGDVWYVKTQIHTDKDQSQSNKKNSNISYNVSLNLYDFFNKLESQNQKDICPILAECDTNLFKIISKTAQGYYTDKQQIEQHDSSDDELLVLYRHNLNNFEKVAEELNTKFEEAEKLNKIWKNFKKTKITSIHGEPHSCNFWNKPLLFINSLELPKKIAVVGYPSTSTNRYVNVKNLNVLLFNLVKKGMDINVPSNWLSQNTYWDWLNKNNIPIEFILSSSEDLDYFPESLKYQKHQSLKTTGQSFKSLQQNSIIKELQEYKLKDKNILCLKNPQWQKEFNWNKETSQKNQKTHISVTQFQKFVECPLQFFYTYVIKIDSFDNKILDGDHLNSGIRVHSIAEKFITRLKFFSELFLAEAINKFLDFFLNFMESNQSKYSNNKSVWIKNAIDKITDYDFNEKEKFYCEQTLFEIADIIFEDQKISAWNFDDIYAQEISKRGFLQILRIEKNRLSLKEGISKKSIHSVEFPINFEFEEIFFHGRLDAVEKNDDGFHIVDYKTARISSTIDRLTWRPQSVAGAQWSLQAGVYSYGYALQHGPVKSFSLCRLKNVNQNLEPYIALNFEPPLQKDTQEWKEISEFLSTYSNWLHEGIFLAHPRHTDICLSCPINTLCPKGHEALFKHEEQS